MKQSFHDAGCRRFPAGVFLVLLFLAAGLLNPSIRAAAPALGAARLPDGRITVAWPAAASDYVLEQSAALGPAAAWAGVTDSAVTAGDTRSVTLSAVGAARYFRLRQAGGALVTVAATLPAAGEAGVSVRRETVFLLSGPLAADTVLRTNHLYALAAGRRLLTRTELGSDRLRATLFCLEDLPGGTRVEVRFDGTGLTDELGRGVDPDGDGVAGGVRTLAFTTFNSAPLAGTAVIGRVLASEQGPGGTDVPLPGVTITVDGQEQSLRTVTAADGTFRLQPAPAGRFFVNVDGRTSPLSAWPGGAYYPTIGKAWEAETGRTNNLAGGSGVIYLPLVAAGTLQPVSATEETRITFPAAVTNANPALAGVEVTVPPNALFADSGTRGGLVGLAPVASDRLPEPLPGGLTHALDISIQTSGPQNFDVPVPAKFPNLPDPVTGLKLPPGAKTALWSFNHDTGRWEMQGPMTVTPDGDFAVTDPGVGIRQPGWHGTAPGSPGGGGPGGGGGGCPDGGGSGGGILEEGTSGGGTSNCDCKDEPSENKMQEQECLAEAARCALKCYEKCGGGGPINSFKKAFKIGYECKKAADCSIKCKQAGERCKDHWQNCFLGGGRLRLLRHGLVLAAAADIENDPAIIESLGILADLDALDPLWDALVAVMDNAPTYEELTPQQQVQFDAIVAQIEAITGNGTVGEWAAGRLERLSQLILASPLADAVYPAVSGHYVIEDLDSGLVRRGRTEPRGYLNGIILRPDTAYRIRLLLEAELIYHEAEFTSASAGRPTYIPYGDPVPFGAADADSDGIPAEGEFVLGTRDDRADTDGDGIADRQELINGTNPLDGLPPANGVVAALDTPGTAMDVTVAGNVALVADGAAGVAVVDITDPLRPALLMQLDTPGTVGSVALDGPRGAATDGTGGLLLLDLTTPAAPVVTARVPLPGVSRVVVFRNGVAYVGSDQGRVSAVDVFTGTVLQTLALPQPQAVSDLGFDGSFLYAWAYGRLHVIGFNGDVMEWRSSVDVQERFPGVEPVRRRLHVGPGRIYGVHLEGVAVFDLPEPGQPALIRRHDTTQTAWKQLVPALADFAVAADGVNFSFPEPHDFSIYRLGDDGAALEFITSFPTPGLSHAVALGGGFAYIADGAAGLQVVNFLTPDTAGVPPTVALTADFPFDPPRLESGQPGRLVALAADDVMVREVQFFRDGEPVLTDRNWPFELRFTAPELTATVTSLRLGARAVDTAGNASALVETNVTLLPDRTPPRVTAFAPGDGDVADAVTVVLARFNEPLDFASITPARAALLTAGADLRFGTTDDAPVAGGTTGYSGTARAVTLEFAAPLPVGRYRFTVRDVADLAGNALAAPAGAEFWIAPGGPGGDPDGDGLNNADESAAGTSPFTEDTDGDGWADEVEVNDGRDPRDPASQPRQVFAARPPVEMRVESAAETAPAGPHVARPPVALHVTSAAEAAPPGPFVARPPVELQVTSAAEDAPAGPFLARPPVQVNVIPAAEQVPPGPHLARPPVTVKRN